MDEKDIKYQIFISSTYNDLVQERAAIIETVLQLEHIPLGMEAFTATARKQMELIERAIDLSDYFVLIIGNRYGSIYKDDVSYTETEYDYAKSKGKPVLAFIQDCDIFADPTEEQEKKVKLFEFIKKVRKYENSGKPWTNKDELAGYVAISLSKEIKNNKQVGWVRADKAGELIDEDKEKALVGNRLLENEARKAISGAKNSILVSGTSMGSLGDAMTILSAINQEVSVTFVFPDYGNEHVMGSIERFFVGKKKHWVARNDAFNRCIETVQKKRNVNVIRTDIFLPFVYVAVDYREVTAFSYIQVRHYLLSIEGTSRDVFFVVRPGERLYERYREQVLLIEKSGGKLADLYAEW